MAQTLVQRSRRVAPAEKAAYHEIEGAGRSRVKREFLGLTPDDERQIVATIETWLDRVVRSTHPTR